MEILKMSLIFGIVGHAINMWCDRALSITPNGKLTFSTILKRWQDCMRA